VSRSPYRTLDAAQIVETAQTLVARIRERFPDSGLRRLATELVEVGRDTTRLSRWLGRPVWPIRALAVLTSVAIAALAIAILVSVDRHLALYATISDLLQGLDAGVNELVLLGAATWFLLSWEQRFKRGRALATLHELRSMAHIVDMHQLTKDPERVLRRGRATASSPQGQMSAFELTRYLDYCSEMLSVLSKLAALLVQDFDDGVTLAGVDEIESLCSGLSRKIWQKIGLVSDAPLAAHRPVPDVD